MHYGDGTNDVTPAGKNQHQDGHRTKSMQEEMRTSTKAYQDKMSTTQKRMESQVSSLVSRLEADRKSNWKEIKSWPKTGGFPRLPDRGQPGKNGRKSK
jgi:hypothetical protein